MELTDQGRWPQAAGTGQDNKLEEEREKKEETVKLGGLDRVLGPRLPSPPSPFGKNSARRMCSPFAFLLSPAAKSSDPSLPLLLHLSSSLHCSLHCSRTIGSVRDAVGCSGVERANGNNDDDVISFFVISRRS